MTRTQCSHPDCNACAREFFRWWNTREAQMANSKDGCSFQAAAVSSVRPPRPAVGAVVRSKVSPKVTGVVLHNSGSPGGDGRHWVQVAVDSGEPRPWVLHFEAKDLDDQPPAGR